jgi:hypothetical protein
MKPSLKEAAGKYLHAAQIAPLSPYAIQKEGVRYQDLEARHFSRGEGFYALAPAFFVSPEKAAAWGWGSYAIAPDGSLSLACFSYDSSD